MMTPHQNVLERMEQSFLIFRKYILFLILPVFLYKLIGVFVTSVSMYFIASKMSQVSIQSPDFFSFLNTPFVVISIVVGTMGFIVYLCLYVAITLTVIKSVHQAFTGEKIIFVDNLIYGLKKFGPSMQTYWFVFAYVALIPAIVFIFGGILFNLSFFIPSISGIMKEIGGVMMGISCILFVVFAIYRGMKSTFALYSAVAYDTFTKKNFKKSLEITHNQWWRIVGNILLVSIFLALLSGIFSVLIPSGFDFTNIHSLEDLKKMFDNFSFILYFFGSLVKSFLDTLTLVFTIVFIYIFFKRLEQESSENI